MHFVVSGHLRNPCPLSPGEFFTLAIREWEVVRDWLASGTALAYGRLISPEGGALLLDVGSEAEARALVRTLPFAPYTDMRIRPSDRQHFGRHVAEALLTEPWAAAS